MIVLYSTGCPVCAVLKARLDRAGVSYETETDPQKILELGIQSVPMLRVNDRLLTAQEAMKWISDGVNA